MNISSTDDERTALLNYCDSLEAFVMGNSNLPIPAHQLTMAAARDIARLIQFARTGTLQGTATLYAKD